MTKEQWETVSSRARVVLNYGVAQTERLEKSRIARFIAEVPFLAGCDKALVTSFTHLLTYLVSLDESAKEIFFHRAEDDGNVYSRLAPLLSFSGGDQKTLDCCRDLLALCMVSNYRKDAESDRAVGKYNPLNTGSWDGDALVAELSASVGSTITPEISAYYTAEDALRGAWKD